MALDNIKEKGQPIRTVYQRTLPEDPTKDYYFILRETADTEAILVEYGFIDNPADAKRLKENLNEYAEAVVEAIADYSGVPYNPPGQTSTDYIVKPGDTLYSISQQNNISIEELKRINNLTSDILKVGQKLKLTPTNIPTETIKYTVKVGDTLYKIAKDFNTTVSIIKDINNLTSDFLTVNQVLNIPTATKEEENLTTYEVKKGDSIYSISRKFNITPNELININNLSNTVLQLGQILKVPNNQEQQKEYKVVFGDSLYSIARKFNTTVDELKQINNLTSTLLSVGQILKIPN